MANKTKVFISYAHSDKPFVEQLARDLESNDAGLKIWYDATLCTGDEWEPELRRQMAESHYCIVVLSRNVYSEGQFRSKWVPLEIEWALAFEADKHRPTFRLFHVRLDGSEIPSRLRNRQCADFRESYQHGLNQLTFRLLSLEKYRRLFVDRTRELDKCLAIFGDACHAQIIYHRRHKAKMGSTFLLRYLEERIPIRTLTDRNDRPIPVFFGPQEIINPLGWLSILDQTVQRAGEKHFQNYLQTREIYIGESGGRQAQRPGPEGGYDIQPAFDMRGIELYRRRSTSFESGVPYTMDHRRPVSETLTTMFLRDLEYAPIPGVVWLIDGPDEPQWMGVNGIDHMMHDWLTSILRRAARGELPKFWIITGGRYSPIPLAQAQGFCCPLGEFDQESVEEYLDRRLPTSDHRYKAMLARLVLRETRHPAQVCQLIEELIREVALE